MAPSMVVQGGRAEPWEANFNRPVLYDPEDGRTGGRIEPPLLQLYK